MHLLLGCSQTAGPIIITIQEIHDPGSLEDTSGTGIICWPKLMLDLFHARFLTLVLFAGTSASQATALGSHTLTLSYSSPQVPVKKARVRNLSGCYVCEKCGKSFKWMPNLRRHLRLECGKEPKHECPYCEYKAKQKSHLKTHIKGRHPETFEFDL